MRGRSGGPAFDPRREGERRGAARLARGGPPSAPRSIRLGVMANRPRSLYLSDEVVDEIDRRAHLDGRNRSNWLNQYLTGCLIARKQQAPTQAPIPPRQWCACGHAYGVHDDQGCLVPQDNGLCSCPGYEPGFQDETAADD